MDEGRIGFKRQIAPGLWEDVNGHGHFDIPTILLHLGIENTPENHDFCLAMVKEMVAHVSPEVKLVINRETPDDN